MSDGEAGAQSSVRSPASPPGAKLARAHTYPVAQRSSPGRGKGRGRGKGALAAAGAPGPRGRKATSCHRWTSEEELRLRLDGAHLRRHLLQQLIAVLTSE